MPCEHFRLKCAHSALAAFNADAGLRLAAGPCPPDEATTATLFLLLDELLTNVIKYGHPGQHDTDHEIGVMICLEPTELVIEIVDDGVPFDPTAPPPPTTAALAWEDRPVGGWGLELVRRTVDEAAYRRDQSRNRLTLRKRLAPDP